MKINLDIALSGPDIGNTPFAVMEDLDHVCIWTFGPDLLSTQFWNTCVVQIGIDVQYGPDFVSHC